MPINKEANGKNLMGLKDDKGILFVEEFVKAAKNGGGFVTYYFEKPGKGSQPKLSYVKTIPGTDILIGTGVYIDNVEAEKVALRGEVHRNTNGYMLYGLYFFLFLLAVTVLLSLLIARSVNVSLISVIDGMHGGADQVTMACSQIAVASQHLAEGSAGHRDRAGKQRGFEMDKVVQENAASAEESAGAGEELVAQAEQMKRYVADLGMLVGGKASVR